MGRQKFLFFYKIRKNDCKNTNNLIKLIVRSLFVRLSE